LKHARISAKVETDLRLGYAQGWIKERFLKKCSAGGSGLRPVFVQGWAKGRDIGGTALR
jgi:hypothetical protein